MTAGTRTVDPSSDTGEAFGACRMENGAAPLRVAASANVACGWNFAAGTAA